MVGDIKIKENRELLARIVAEKGFFGYKWQHHEILDRIITPETTYEGLSDENREILYDVTGLDEEEIKFASKLFRVKNADPVDIDIDEEGNQTVIEGANIGYMKALLPYKDWYTYTPFPEEKRRNPIEEYIDFMNISLNALRVHSNPRTSEDMPLEFRFEIKRYFEKRYGGLHFDGLVRFFNDTVIFDASLYQIAFRHEIAKRRKPTWKGDNGFYILHKYLVEGYNSYRGYAYQCDDMEAFRKSYNYVDFGFPQANIVNCLSAKEIYSQLYGKVEESDRSGYTKELLAGYEKRINTLIGEVKSEKVNDWQKTLLGSLKELSKWISDYNRKNIDSDLRDKMRVYLLDLLAGPSLQGETADHLIHKIYGTVLGTKDGNVKSNLERLRDKDGDLG